jgi:hypothetical protein
MPSIALPSPTVAGRAALAVAGVAAAVAAAVVFAPWVLALWLVPDAVLIGAFAEGGDDRLKPRAVAAYNAVHALPAPLAAVAVGAALGSDLVVGLALVWLSHCLLDRAMGFGLRAEDGSQRA